MNFHIDNFPVDDSFLCEYLRSDKYTEDMLSGSEKSLEEFSSFLYDAEAYSDNYRIRHFSLSRRLGGWIWKGIYLHRRRFVSLLFNKDLRGVDFGGASRPILADLDVVDLKDFDCYNRRVKYRSISEVKGSLDFVFSSHTFEHIPDLGDSLQQIHSKLKVGGILALNLPSYTCQRWRAFSGSANIDHVHTFKLMKTNVDEELPHLVDIDFLIENAGFNINIAEYTGDNSIVIFGEKS